MAKITEGFARNDKALAQEGMKFLGKYAIMMGLGGAGVQQLKSLLFSGTLEDMDAGDIALNAFKTMGYNEFMREKWRQGKKVESVMDTALPPYQAWNTLMKADRDSVKSLPVVGKLFHSWLLGGAEVAVAQRARRKATEKRRSQPGYEDRMERLREARRARLIAEGRSAR